MGVGGEVFPGGRGGGGHSGGAEGEWRRGKRRNLLRRVRMDDFSGNGWHLSVPEDAREAVTACMAAAASGSAPEALLGLDEPMALRWASWQPAWRDDSSEDAQGTLPVGVEGDDDRRRFAALAACLTFGCDVAFLRDGRGTAPRASCSQRALEVAQESKGRASSRANKKHKRERRLGDLYTDAYVAHALRLVLSAQAVVTRNSKEVKRLDAAEDTGVDAVTDAVRDQGFTRPRVLVVVPSRGCAVRVVASLMALCPCSGSQTTSSGTQSSGTAGKGGESKEKERERERMDRFLDEFVEGVGGVDYDEEEDEYRGRPSDWRDTFAGNVDDCFVLGASVSRKAGVRLYTGLFRSDILVASPLGVRTYLTAVARKEREREREAEKAPGGTSALVRAAKRQRDGDDDGEDNDGRVPMKGKAAEELPPDFLSSIELCVVDHVDVLQMQNLDHTDHLLGNLLCKMPRESHGCDFRRVKHIFLDGKAREGCQTVFLSAYQTPEASALVSRHTRASSTGVATLKQRPERGVLGTVAIALSQVFVRVTLSSLDPAAESDARFNHFCHAVWPRLRDYGQAHVLLYVRTYFDYVRLRNFLEKEKASFVACSEYSNKGHVTRNRSRFFHGQRKIMLLSERFHFYNRYRIRGTRSVLFYSPPSDPHTYPEILNNIAEGGNHASGSGATAKAAASTAGSLEAGSSVVLFTLCDKLFVERMVGRKRCKNMLTSERSSFLFS